MPARGRDRHGRGLRGPLALAGPMNPRAVSPPARVPLAAAVDAVPDQPARVVVFRRPLEHRAASRRGLRILVYRTIVEQLSALTGRSVDEIDPEGLSEED